MTYSKIALITLTAMSMIGCNSTPKLANPLTAPTIPKSAIDTIVSDVAVSNDYNIADNIVQSRVHQIKTGSSVVINVPADFFEKQSAHINKSNQVDSEFKTKEFFNYAEQEIERELIRHGFSVLSRSKFEAKLRDLRDESSCNDKWWRCASSQVEPEIAAILEQLETKFSDGKITAAEYASQTQEFKAKMQSSSSGKSRKNGDRELTDISEVIRAAQSGEIRSDYILQINSFNTNKLVSTDINLLENKDIRNFVTNHEGIKEEFKENQYLNCWAEGAELNAKIIDVKSGAIVWIGKHEVNELNSGVTNLSVELGQKTSVSNTDEVNSFIAFQNSSQQRINRYGQPDPKAPEWTYRNELVGPSVVSGRCNPSGSNFRMDKNSRTKLARSVAKKLIQQIVVTQAE